MNRSRPERLLDLRLLLATACLFILAGCVPAAAPETPALSVTPTPAGYQNLPLVFKQPTATPSPTPTLTPTPDPTVLPDLTIPYTWVVVYDDPCPWGSPGTITVSVQNIGNAAAGPFVAAILDREKNYSGLPAGATVPLVYKFQSGPVGGIYSTADIYDQVVERDEGNNEMQIVFTPPPPCGSPPAPQP